MTVDEFKQRFPEHSHLEGNELWNAMENSALNGKRPYKFKSETKEDCIEVPVYDCNGEEIKEGDTVGIYYTDTVKVHRYGIGWVGKDASETKWTEYPNENYNKEIKSWSGKAENNNGILSFITKMNIRDMEVTNVLPVKWWNWNSNRVGSYIRIIK